MSTKIWKCLVVTFVCLILFDIYLRLKSPSRNTGNSGDGPQNTGHALRPIKYVKDAVNRKTIKVQDGQHWKDAVLEIMKEHSDVDSNEIDRKSDPIFKEMQYCEDATVNVFYKKYLRKDAKKMGVHHILLFMLYRSGDDCVVSSHIGSFEIPSDA
eukprot:780518_1